MQCFQKGEILKPGKELKWERVKVSVVKNHSLLLSIYIYRLVCLTVNN